MVPVYQELCPDRSAALRRERAIKSLSRPQKLALCRRNQPPPTIPEA
ncbi:MAG: GIY-YIG nuclease family protein [Oscillospiraceae bacterium]